MIVAVALIFVVKPVAAWFALSDRGLRWRARAVMASYGVRGIGSIYYLAYAGHHVELVNEGALCATIALTIIVSTLIHGLTAGFAVQRVIEEQ